jgi:alpha-2-macroglobulin
VNATAQCLEALLSAQGGFAGDEKAVAWMVGERKNKGRWESTQENAWGLRAFGAYFKRYEADAPKFNASLSLVGPSGTPKSLWEQAFEGRSLDAPSKSFGLDTVFGQGEQARLQFAKAGSGRLYYGFSMSYLPKSFSKPAWEGFELERSVAPLGSKQALAAGEAYKAGQRYVVTLRVRTRQDRTFVALTDPLPGGLEVIDSSFATESQAEAQQKAAQSPSSSGWTSGFQHAENYDDRVQVFANYMPQGDYTWSYLVQATTPGVYSKPSAWVEQMYEPEVFGRTPSQAVDVR